MIFVLYILNFEKLYLFLYFKIRFLMKIILEIYNCRYRPVRNWLDPIIYMLY